MSHHKNNKNPYEVLGVSNTASAEDIKKSYRELCKVHHPDVGGNPDKMKEINVAYDILSDELKRKDYDEPQNNPNFNPFGNNPFSQGSQGFHTNPFDGINLQDILNNMHGFRFETNLRGGPQGFTRNLISKNLKLPLEKALEGGPVEIDISSLRQTIRFDLPRPVVHGSVYTLRVNGNEKSETVISLEVSIEMPTLTDKQIMAFKAIFAPVVEKEEEPLAENTGSTASN